MSAWRREPDSSWRVCRPDADADPAPGVTTLIRPLAWRFVGLRLAPMCADAAGDAPAVGGRVVVVVVDAADCDEEEEGDACCCCCRRGENCVKVPRRPIIGVLPTAPAFDALVVPPPVVVVVVPNAWPCTPSVGRRLVDDVDDADDAAPAPGVLICAYTSARDWDMPTLEVDMAECDACARVGIGEVEVAGEICLEVWLGGSHQRSSSGSQWSEWSGNPPDERAHARGCHRTAAADTFRWHASVGGEEPRDAEAGPSDETPRGRAKTFCTRGNEWTGI